jgi:hypothetical protein
MVPNSYIGMHFLMALNIQLTDGGVVKIKSVIERSQQCHYKSY